MFDENEVRIKMDKVVENLENRFTTVRAGRANPNILNGIMIEYYGTLTPIQSLATISIPEANKLFIKPFDKTLLKNIEKSIYEAELGMAPTNNGEIIILSIPTLTEETRRNYVKQVKDMIEDARIALRTIRQEVNNSIKKSESSENEQDVYLEIVQKLIDKYNKVLEDKCKNNINLL